MNNAVLWCENNQLYQVDCTIRNKTCVYSSVEGYYGCAETQPPVNDPCGGITYKGVCDDAGTVTWCESGELFALPCAFYGGECAYDSSRGINNCLY